MKVIAPRVMGQNFNSILLTLAIRQRGMSGLLLKV